MGVPSAATRSGGPQSQANKLDAFINKWTYRMMQNPQIQSYC